MEVNGLIELSKLTSVCSKGWAPSGKPLGAFLKQIPELSKKPGITAHRSVFLDSVCILSRHSQVVSIEVRERLPILPVVFGISFSETTLCLALLSLLSMPFKCITRRQDRVSRQASGSDHSSQSDFPLARSV